MTRDENRWEPFSGTAAKKDSREGASKDILLADTLLGRGVLKPKSGPLSFGPSCYGLIICFVVHVILTFANNFFLNHPEGQAVGRTNPGRQISQNLATPSPTQHLVPIWQADAI